MSSSLLRSAAAPTIEASASSDAAVAAPPPTKRPRGRPRKQQPLTSSSVEATDAASSAPAAASAAASLGDEAPISPAARAKAQALMSTLRSSLRAAGDPTKAAGMQRYMKSAIPFHGVAAPTCRALFRDAFSNLAFASASEWSDTVRALWLLSTHREEWYAAVALARLDRDPVRSWRLSPDALPLFRFLISRGAWWDLVDDLASHHVGDLLRSRHREVKPTLERWSRGEDLWLRRAAILSQLGSKGPQLDLDFLHRVIEPSIDSHEFFLRKAIGWALRQVARERPRDVVRYVCEHETRLSTLSIREALKHLGGSVAEARRRYMSDEATAAASSSSGAATAAKKRGRRRKNSEDEEAEQEEALATSVAVESSEAAGQIDAPAAASAAASVAATNSHSSQRAARAAKRSKQ